MPARAGVRAPRSDPEQGEDGANPAVDIGRRLEAQLVEHRGARSVDRALANAEQAYDAGVRPTLGHQGEDRVVTPSGRLEAIEIGGHAVESLEIRP